MRTNPKGRRTKSKARLANYERLLAEERNVKLDQVQIHIPAGQRLGGKVIEADDVRKGFGDRLLIEDLSFSLPPAGIVGVIGANGAGKTTLFRMIVGDEKPDAGAITLGDTVDLAYVDQSRDALDPDKTVWEEISEGYDNIKVGDREMNSRAYVAGFNFKGSDQQKKVGTLSGGERNRVHLAKLLRRGGNVLLLDEPTNDLDVDTLRALEEALLAFPGCAVIISHDRWFLDRVATHVLAFEGDSQVHLVRGQLRGLRGVAPRAARRRGRPPAPHHVQEAHPRVSAARPLLHRPRVSARPRVAAAALAVRRPGRVRVRMIVLREHRARAWPQARERRHDPRLPRGRRRRAALARPPGGAPAPPAGAGGGGRDARRLRHARARRRAGRAPGRRDRRLLRRAGGRGRAARGHGARPRERPRAESARPLRYGST